jgi:flagellar protein FlbD
MVKLTKLNGDAIVVNADLVEFIEETPDCLLSMTTGRKLMVREKLPEVIDRLREYLAARRGAYPVPAGGEGYKPFEVEERARERDKSS